MLRGPMGTGRSKAPSGYKQYQIKQFDDSQMGLYDSLFAHLDPNSFLAKIASGDEQAMAEMEAPAYREFAAQQGDMASRFSGMGTGGRHSSGFQNTMSAAASNFAQDMGAKRMNARMKALEELMSFSDRLLNQRPYETGLVQKQRKPSMMNSFAQGVGGAIPGMFTGGFSNMFGGGYNATPGLDYEFRSGSIY